MAAVDHFDEKVNGMESSARNIDSITPADSELVNMSRAVYVGSAGNMKVITYGDETITFQGIPAGSLLPIVVKQIYSTDTTASAILVLY